MTGLAPLCYLTGVDIPVQIDVPLQDQVCFYGWCLPTDAHAEGCEAHTELEVATARLHWKLREARARKNPPCSTFGSASQP